MRTLRSIAAGLVLGTLVIAVMALAAGAASRSTARERQIERGRYISIIAACNDCHTPGFFYGAPDFERELSGSEIGWVGPWGVTFPRNLTPDMETGIGRWSEQDIVNAVRTGMRPDGSVIQPPMPWPNYASMTDEDAFALAAYLKSLKPVNHRPPDRLPSGTAYTGPAFHIPPAPTWDAPRPAAADAK
jgi:mono/diheme cytochrome c family protein